MAKQFELFDDTPAMTGRQLSEYLNDGARCRVRVKMTRNRVSMLSITFGDRDPIVVRAHEAFLSAPESVRRALRTYIRTQRRDAWNIVSAFARAIPADVRHEAVTSPIPGHRGEFYDLAAIFRDVNRTFFNNRIDCVICWGRGRPVRSRAMRSRSIRYGSWDPAQRVIRIHPALDDVRVPFDFVRYIVFHEMLHVVVPADFRNGRRYDHTPQFRKLERQYPGFERMAELAKELMGQLLE